MVYMSAMILNGTELSNRIRSDIKKEVESLREGGVVPGLAVVLVGNDPASRIYVNRKKKACEETGIRFFEHTFEEDTAEDKLVSTIEELNRDEKVNGILVQLPLPEGFNQEKLLDRIDPLKDVDGLHPFNTGKLLSGAPVFLPCTPAGIMELMEANGISVAGKECVVVGRSNIVGKPAAVLLLLKNGTVTVCHSRTRNLEEVCRRADILVVAIGKPEFVNGSFVKEGACVIDVGINRLGDGKLAGDVKFEEVSRIASAITPVPGGVGPMTIAMLLKNTVKAAKIQKGLA